MNRQYLQHKISVITEQLTIEQLMYARRNRNWEKFDKLNEIEKLIVRLEELEIYQDDIDPYYTPKF